MSNLITPSLISSVNWLKTCPPTWKVKAYNDLKNTLARIYMEPSPEIKRGIECERKVNEILTSRVDVSMVKCSDNFKKLLTYCNGYTQQKVTKKILTIDDEEYCLYGKIDYYKPDHIIDLKTTNEYKPSKYLNSYQHKIYCYIERITKFTYLVAEFYKSDKITKVVGLEILFDEFDLIEKEIILKIKEVISFLKLDDTLFTLYKTTFSKY